MKLVTLLQSIEESEQILKSKTRVLAFAYLSMIAASAFNFVRFTIYFHPRDR